MGPFQLERLYDSVIFLEEEKNLPPDGKELIAQRWPVCQGPEQCQQAPSEVRLGSKHQRSLPDLPNLEKPSIN